MFKILLAFENYLTVNRYTKNSVRSKIYNQKSFLNWLKSENLEYVNVSYADVLAYINYCKDEGNQTRTINQKLTSLKQFYTFLEEKK